MPNMLVIKVLNAFCLFDYKKVVFWSPAEYSPRKTCKTTGIDTFESSFVVCFREF